jgi:LmbE family N-acetylglucosaminyl deacetylase
MLCLTKIALIVDVNLVWEQKLAAIRCHRTQLRAAPILSAPAEQQRLFLGWEHFTTGALWQQGTAQPEGGFLRQLKDA